MKIAIYSPSGSVSPKHNSHRSAWVHMRIDQMIRDRVFGGEEIEWVLQPKKLTDDFELVLIYNGIEMDISSPAHPRHGKAPPLNMFGGMPPNWEKYQRLIDYTGDLAFLDFSVDYAALLAKRGDAEDYYNQLVRLKERLDDLPVIKQMMKSTVVLGDSHAISSYVPGSTVIRCDFLTLKGGINRGLHTIAPHDQFDNLHINLGNIDLRHHMCREASPHDRAKFLADLYAGHVRNHFGQYNVTLTELMPIEAEYRKTPTTGWFKGKPFAGSWEEREAVRLTFNDRLKKQAKKNGFEVYTYPKTFYNGKGELDQIHMQANSGVHLSWAAGRFMRGDYE